MRQSVEHIEAPNDQTWCGLRVSRKWEEWETYAPGDLTGRFPPCERCEYHRRIGRPAPLIKSDYRRRDWQREWPPQRVAATANAPHAAYLDATETVRLALFPSGAESIQPRTIIEVGGIFLVEAVGEPDDWYMGLRAPDGVIECWGKYGDLETALGSL